MNELFKKGQIMLNKKHIGSNFDSFLEEEKILQESEAVAKERIKAFIQKQKEDKNIDS